VLLPGRARLPACLWPAGAAPWLLPCWLTLPAGRAPQVLETPYRVMRVYFMPRCKGAEA
jgi:hypothetical protein